MPLPSRPPLTPRRINPSRTRTKRPETLNTGEGDVKLSAKEQKGRHMDSPTLIGSLGVALLLLAFFLSLFKFITQDGFAYIGMNIAGAGFACWSSWVIAFMPFVILEAVWCAVACAALARRIRESRMRTS